MSVEDRLRVGLSGEAEAVTPEVEWQLERVMGRGLRRTRMRRAGYGIAVAAASAAAVVLAFNAGVFDPSVNEHVPGPVNQPEQIQGEYVVEISQATDRQADMVGRWRVELADGGVLRLVPPRGYAGTTSGSSYRVAGDVILTNAFVDRPGCQTVERGSYRWKRTGSTLRFAVVDDSCADRELLFADQTWEALP
jgi:hypothetical protein